MLDSRFGLKYSMPHVLVHIVDNSARTAERGVTIADDPSMYATLVVSGFPLGEDRKIVNVTRSDILNIAYGLGNITPSDIEKYGQTITYPTALIDQGAPVQLLRITPDDATYAYSCITIEWYWSDEDNKMHVRFNTARLGTDRELTNYQNRERLNAAIVKAVNSDSVPGEGGTIWKRRAFIVNISAGRGAAYNYFATAINQTLQAKRPANVRYLFQTIDTLKNNVVEQFYGTLLNADNVLANATSVVDTVNTAVKKRAAGSSVVVPYLNEAAVRELYEEYHAAYAGLLADETVIKTEYELNVFKALTPSTFDPIFGLYLYEGTDSNNKLPYFQVDMRSADMPRLDTATNVIYRPNTDTVSQKTTIGTRLMDVTTGIYDNATKPTVKIGDLFLASSGNSSTNNPFVYFIAAINQVTGAVTPIRTNQMHYQDNTMSTTSTLASVFEFDTKEAFFEEFCRRLSRNIVRDGDTIAWVDPSKYFGASTADTDGPKWRLFYVASGCYELAKQGKLYALLISEWGTGESGTTTKLKKYKMNDGDGVADYSFIAWDGGINIGDLVAVSPSAQSFNRPGGTVIVGNGGTYTGFVAFGPDAQPVYVNGQEGGVSAEDKYYVEGRTCAEIFQTGTPEAKVSTIVKDVAGTMFDYVMCDPALSPAQKMIDNGTAGTPDIEIVSETSLLPSGDADSFKNAYLGFRPLDVNGDRRFIFLKPAQKMNGETPVADTYVVDVFQNCNDVANSYVDDYLGAAGKTFYIANYVREGYYNSTDDKFYTNDQYTGDPIEDDANSIYKALGETVKYYKYDESASPKYTEVSAITDDYQIILWYVKSGSTGNWIPYVAPADGHAAPGGITFTIKKTSFEVALDARSAEKITRYTVTGTLGSLFRIQEMAVEIPTNYYSDQYGINVTSSEGGVKLADGYTGFFDDTTLSSIEYKWKYSKLLVDAYRGRIDPRIMSPIRVPAKFLFDGGTNTIVGQTILPTMKYTAADLITASTVFTDDEKDDVLFHPQVAANLNGNDQIDVKQAMYDLMIHRVYEGMPEDKRPVGPGSGISLHLDSGFTDTTTSTLINNSFMKRFDNPNASWDIGGYTSATDGVTYTFVKNIVDHLIAHCKGYSINKPYTGVYTKIRPDEYTTFFPDVDTTDWEYNELTYKSGGNSWLPDVNGNLMRSSQKTLMRGSDTSDLIQESNMRTLTQLVYLLQNKLREKLHEYNDDSVLRTMQDEVNNMFSGWVGDRVQSLNINFERDTNPDDGGEVIVCWVDVTFRGINLRIPVIVNVNQRSISTQ